MPRSYIQFIKHAHLHTYIYNQNYVTLWLHIFQRIPIVVIIQSKLHGVKVLHNPILLSPSRISTIFPPNPPVIYVPAIPNYWNLFNSPCFFPFVSGILSIWPLLPSMVSHPSSFDLYLLLFQILSQVTMPLGNMSWPSKDPLHHHTHPVDLFISLINIKCPSCTSITGLPLSQHLMY